MMKTGIYAIEHVESGKVYIGSAVDFVRRWGLHRYQLRRNKHHSNYLQHAWNKYGEGAFEFRKLITCEKEDLIFWEQLFINGHKAADMVFGYNSSPTAGNSLGWRPTPEQLVNMRAGFAKRPRRPQTEETKRKIGAAHAGRVYGTEFREDRRRFRSSKLNAQKAEEIRVLHTAGATNKELATRYMVSPATISDVVCGRRWAPILPGTTSDWRQKR